MKLESTGCSDSKRICDDDGKLLAMCERYTSGYWAVHDKHTDHRLCLPVHKTARKAMKWFSSRKTAVVSVPDNNAEKLK